MTMPTTGFDAIAAVEALGRFEIVLPAEAAGWFAKLTELRETRPSAPAHDAVARLLADSAKPAAVDKALAAHLAAQHLANQHRLAEAIVGQRVLDAILADRGDLHRQLAEIATGHIVQLHKAAAVDDSIADLTRQGRTDDARLVATVEGDVERLRQAFHVRDSYLTPQPGPQRWSTGRWNCSAFRNPWEIQHPAMETEGLWGVWRANIKAGGQMWFPTVEEAREASAQHEPPGTVLAPITPTRPAGRVAFV